MKNFQLDSPSRSVPYPGFFLAQGGKTHSPATTRDRHISVSHPFRQEREKDGARRFLPIPTNSPLNDSAVP